MKNKFFLGILLAVLFFGSIVWYVISKVPVTTSSNGGGPSANVSVVDGKQIVDITAKGGYTPRETVAKAHLPTVVRIKTQGTFDCSSQLTIPVLRYQKSLQPTGVEEIVVTPDQARGTLRGICSMGMYSFKVVFN